MIQVGLLGVDDAPELFAAIVRSRALHEPWITPPATVLELSESLGWPPDVRTAYGIREAAGQLAGVVEINSIIRGAFDNGFLGYFALVPYEGRGYVRAGLVEVIERAFTEHGLHRLEVSIQPENTRSVRLVQGLDFRLEGHSPRYLKIGGEWRDHDRYALTVEEWATSPHRAAGPSA
jgi:[ribosomal protein S5]-alanine N-acetyltransferase